MKSKEQIKKILTEMTKLEYHDKIGIYGEAWSFVHDALSNALNDLTILEAQAEVNKKEEKEKIQID